MEENETGMAGNPTAKRVTSEGAVKLKAQLKRPSYELEGIASLMLAAQELTTTDDLDKVLDRVAQRVKQDVPYDTFAVLLVDDLAQELRFRYATGYPAKVMQQWRFGPGQGIVGTVLETSQPLRVDDVSSDHRYLTAGTLVRSELAIPLMVQKCTIGVLDVGSEQAGYFTENDQWLLTLLAGHLAQTIENARLYENLRTQAQTLSVLHEVSRDLTSILDQEQLLQRVAGVVKRLVDYQVFTVMLWDQAGGVLQPVFSLRHDDRMSIKGELPLGYGISGTAAALRQPLRVANVHLDPRYVDCGHQVPVESELAVPLLYENRLVGLIDLESTERSSFTEQHEQMLVTLGSCVAIALENARLYAKVRDDEQRLENDLNAARRIQRGLFPPAAPEVPGLEIAISYRPANHLGGDFYDFLPYRDGRLGIAVGDVAGKGAAAALYGSLAIGLLRGNVAEECCCPGDMLRRLNVPLREYRTDKRFVAMVFAIFSPQSRKLIVAAAGFPRPWLIRDGEAEEIVVGGVPLGALADPCYGLAEIALATGDTVVLCSDGFHEAMNECEEEFGYDRMCELLIVSATGPPQEIADALIVATEHYSTGNQPHRDDRTVVVLRVVEE
jgi:sigma-B regulation protein RsbU (phosphoserine phosphatase)